MSITNTETQPRRLQESTYSNRTVKDPHLSTSTSPSISCTNTPPSPTRRGYFPNPQSTYHTILVVSLCQFTSTIHRQFFSTWSSILTTYWFSHPRVLGRHYTSVPNLKGILSFCVLWQVRWGHQLLAMKFCPPQCLLKFLRLSGLSSLL